MAPIQPEWIFLNIEPFADRLVTSVSQPAPSLNKCGGAKEAITIPPMARAARRAAETEDAFVLTIELAALLRGLEPFLLRLRCLGLEPRLDHRVLRKDVREIGDQVLDDPHICKRIDRRRRVKVGNEPRTGEPVRAIYIHGAGSADALPA